MDIDPLREEVCKERFPALRPVPFFEEKAFTEMLDKIKPDASERGDELQKIIDDATYQFILGKINESQFEKAVEKWRTNGGNQVIEEYEESFKKAEK